MDRKWQTIDEYISEYDGEVKEKLELMRKTIAEAVPEATEKISWSMPTFYYYGNLVHFAAHKNHIGFYPGAEGIEVFKEKIKEYQSSKGAVQFPLGQPLPKTLIADIARFRLEQNKKASEKKRK